MKASGNLTDNTIRKTASIYEVISPVTGKPIDLVSLSSKEDIFRSIRQLSRPSQPYSPCEVLEFLHRLKDQFLRHQNDFLEKTILETGFITRDSREMVEGVIEFLSDFETYVKEGQTEERLIRHSYSTKSHRNIRITYRPFQCIAAIVPQNASLSLSITIIAAALYAGTKVILRPSLQCASTGALLSEIVLKSDPPESCITIVNSLAADFLDACYSSVPVDLIHYIGSNQHALPVFTKAFAAGKNCILDGQGNGILYMDDTFPIEEAVRIITSGATRYNGETCTSVNGVLIKDTVYPDVRAALIESFNKLRVGHPLDQNMQIGPLFSEKQASGLRKNLQASPALHTLCGGHVEGAYFAPAIIEGVDLRDPIAREGFFGPAIWIQSIQEDTVWNWLRENRFPLSDTVLSTNRDLIRDFAKNSKAARICVNEDPSVESMFEPWGGYPPSGFNPVSIWTEKYRQAFQLDGKLNDINTIFPRAQGEKPSGE